VNLIDPATGAILTSLGLTANPDYLRYVASTDELWITEPAAAQLEIVALSADAVPALGGPNI
jgi:hypothetical protein